MSFWSPAQQRDDLDFSTSPHFFPQTNHFFPIILHSPLLVNPALPTKNTTLGGVCQKTTKFTLSLFQADVFDIEGFVDFGFDYPHGIFDSVNSFMNSAKSGFQVIFPNIPKSKRPSHLPLLTSHNHGYAPVVAAGEVAAGDGVSI